MNVKREQHNGGRSTASSMISKALKLSKISSILRERTFAMQCEHRENTVERNRGQQWNPVAPCHAFEQFLLALVSLLQSHNTSGLLKRKPGIDSPCIQENPFTESSRVMQKCDILGRRPASH